MRKILNILICLAFALGAKAQQEQIYIHSNGSVIYQNGTSDVENMQFSGHSTIINAQQGNSTFSITSIDSITFGRQELPPPGDMVIITFNGNDVQVENPYSGAGVTVNHNNANVVVNSTKSDVTYRLTGNSSNGSIVFGSSSDFTLQLYELSLSSSTTSAIDIITEVTAEVILTGASSLTDGANGEQKGTFTTSGTLLFNQDFGTLTIIANKKHGINAEGDVQLMCGNIHIESADNDGIHCNSFLEAGGTLIISETGSDGIDCSSDFTMQYGSITITSTEEDVKAIKANGTIRINGGTLDLTHLGDVSKGIKCDGEIIISGGDITIESAGSTVLVQEEGQNIPSYCTAIKSDTDITITGGTFHITLPSSNHGGKSISADGNITISDGNITIETHGDGAAYTVSGDTKDSYTSSCLKCDGNMEILAGTFNLTSTGKGGKGINAGGTLTIGTAGASNEELTLNVTTTGERITVESGGGGWWPGGEGEYANPKAVKSEGDLTINSGNINILCSQTQNEGGECLESKAYLTINGGNIEAYSKKDDAVNATRNITINGGNYYVHSDANDGTDSNGTMFLNGGFLISNGSRQPEEGFDCDNNQFKVTGGTIIGTGGGTSNPTQNVCTQPSLKINTQAGYAIQILGSSGEVIATYQCPEFTGSGGGGGGPGGGGGGNSMVMLFSDPKLQTGSSYTVKYGGTISGGTNTNGYYTGNITYSGGQQTTVNVNSMLTTVSAGGGGGW